MEKIVNIYRKNTSNTGDKFGTPTKYFDFLKDVRTLDITELPIDEFVKEIEGKDYYIWWRWFYCSGLF